MKIYPLVYIAASWAAIPFVSNVETAILYSIGATVGILAMWITK